MRMFKIVFLLCLLFISQLSINRIMAQDTDRWEKDIQAFEQMDAKDFPNRGCNLFVGSSSIRGWTTMQQDLRGYDVVNRGFGGSQLSDVLKYVDRIVTPYQPGKIFLYEGDNDINSGKSAETVLEDFEKFVSLVREKLPEVPIYFMSIKPSPRRWDIWKEMDRANTMIYKYCLGEPNLGFVDVSWPLMDENGQPRKELYQDDMLHLNRAGYDIWTKVVEPYLE